MSHPLDTSYMEDIPGDMYSFPSQPSVSNNNAYNSKNQSPSSSTSPSFSQTKSFQSKTNLDISLQFQSLYTLLSNLSMEQSPNPDHVEDVIRQAKRYINSISYILDNRYIEPDELREYQESLENAKKSIDEWNRKLEKLKRDSLLLMDVSEVNEYGQSRHMRDHMEKTSLILKDSTKRLENSINMLNESERYGGDALITLNDQRHRLGNARDRIYDIQGEQRIGNRVIRRMEWRRTYNQIILIGIIIALIIAILFVIYFGIIRRFIR